MAVAAFDVDEGPIASLLVQAVEGNINMKVAAAVTT
jgi:hypothetical protein